MLGPLVLKLASAYLETRWLWPRQFSPLSNYSFLLTDPRADDLDMQELSRLSDELHIKLFGAAAFGEVTLLLFEGPVDIINAFVGLDNSVVLRALTEPSLLPRGGRLSQVLGSDLVAEVKNGSPGSHRAPLVPAGAATGDAPLTESNYPERLQGIYFTLRGVFIGDVIALNRSRRAHHSIVEGPEHIPADRAGFDAKCVASAIRLLADPTITTVLYVPISYDGIVRPRQRAVYEEMLSALPHDRRSQLAAAVYDVPRDPMFGALNQLRSTLERYFASVDLRVEDPGFEIEKLAVHAVAGVSLGLPNREPRERMSMLRHFATRRAHYKRKQIWASVTNVRTAQELAVCADLGIPFVTGPAVSGLQIRPLGGRMHLLADLPVTEALPSLARPAVSA